MSPGLLVTGSVIHVTWRVVHVTQRYWVDQEKCMSPGLLVTRGVVHVSGRFWHSACHQPGGYREGGACREGFLSQGG